MGYKLQFRPYQRQFKRALSTSHGNWNIREGIILRLIDETGKIGWGEIAPLPWFGSETLAAAKDFCHQLGEEISTETIGLIPDELPACQFGFESAWQEINLGLMQAGEKNQFLRQTRNPVSSRNRVSKNKPSFLTTNYSSLLPTGKAALDSWPNLWNQGFRTFKWKVGVSSIQEEMEIFKQLIHALPTEAKLRLDANGGLTWKTATEWLKLCDKLGDNLGDNWQVEFIEQPLPVGEENAMLELSKQSSTPLALDESVATIKQLETCYNLGWRGIFVIKPCIAGFPSRLRHFCQQHNLDVVFSSVFETAIGRKAALKLAAEIPQCKRALGFGVNHWFKEDENVWFESLWNNL